jgi:23S rRNA (uracil1939-C5)-methyltransferase
MVALSSAARSLTNVTTERRDLFANPLTASELSRFDAVVFDPPRAGAREQSTRIAESGVPTVVAVSCNPATFARDARILTDGGYRLERVTPVDQFVWSAHVELVARFTAER